MSFKCLNIAKFAVEMVVMVRYQPMIAKQFWFGLIWMYFGCSPSLMAGKMVTPRFEAESGLDRLRSKISPRQNERLVNQ